MACCCCDKPEAKPPAPPKRDEGIRLSPLLGVLGLALLCLGALLDSLLW